ncbi:MAG: sugar ABC transporter permease [Candidatus Sumerlaeaceae bacterium]|nr:sugar ABC transporter permease [Candidatus Sumerlaeaceae bacterium]
MAGASPFLPARRAWIPYLCLLPATLLVAAVLMVPIGETCINAFCTLDRYANRTGFAGLRNFRVTLEDTEFRYAFWNTMVWTTAVVVLTLGISLVASLFLNRRFVLRPVARAILILPWASSLVISAIVWRYIFDGEVGPVNAWLIQSGLVSEPIYWLAQRDTSFPVMIGVAVFVSIPFTTTVFLAGLQAIPRDLYEAAKVDGASAVRSFLSITVPHLREVFAIATVINVIYVFNSFPIVWTMTGGGPANTTDIIMTHLYKRAFTDKQFAVASAEAVIVFAVLMAFSVTYSILLRRRGD